MAIMARASGLRMNEQRVTSRSRGGGPMRRAVKRTEKKRHVNSTTSTRHTTCRVVRHARMDGDELRSPFLARNESLSPGLPSNLRGVSLVARASESAVANADIDKIEKPGITKRTLKKIIPLSMIFFFCLFNYTILRDTKDVLVVTAPGGGAESIPFLKTWVNLPFAVLCMVLYTKAGSTLGPEALFNVSLAPFLAFFGLFGFVIYPLHEMLHPTAAADWLTANLGSAFVGPISIIRNWTYALFYVMAEMWGSVIVSLSFWSFANQVTTVEEAKIFYPMFGLGANFALIASGYAVKYFSQVRASLPVGADPWAYSLRGLMGMVLVGGIIMFAVNWFMYRFVLTDPAITGGLTAKKPKKKKAKVGMAEGFKILANNQYIKDLSILVLGYGMAINICEVTWKMSLKKAFPNPNDYSAFMGNFSSMTGVATLIMMVFGRFMLSKFGWRATALVTPSVVMATGLAFFGLLIFSSGGATVMGLSPLFLAVYIGAAQNIFSKSAKYALFDPCKEMAYIPLDSDTRLRGKAAIDVVAARGGKSGGALIQQFLIVAFGSLSACTPILAGILLVTCGQWLRSTLSLAGQFENADKEDKIEKLTITKKMPICSAWTPRPDGVELPIKYRSVSVLDDEGNLESRYIPYTELPEDYFTRILAV